MASKKMNSIDDLQQSLFRGEPVSVDLSLIKRQISLSSAIALCVQAAGLEDKEVYLTLGIDAGHWTRITKGDAHFPVNKLNALMDICGNEAPLQWLANSRGYGLVMLVPESERKLREAEAALIEERARTKWLLSQLNGQAA